MTGQLPFAIAQLLIKCIPAIRSTSDNDTTAMTPVLNAHTNTSLALGNQQDPIFILGHIARHASRIFPVPFLLFAPDAQLFERALEVFGEGHFIGGLLVRLFPAYGRASGW